MPDVPGWLHEVLCTASWLHVAGPRDPRGTARDRGPIVGNETPSYRSRPGLPGHVKESDRACVANTCQFHLCSLRVLTGWLN